MEKLIVTDSDFPGLFQAADSASISEQKKYFNGILWYLIILIFAALVAYLSQNETSGLLKIVSALLFLTTLSILVWLKYTRPDDLWYNGRAVAESVKTRAWRWMMRAEPYEDHEDLECIRRRFISDLKQMLKQNESLIGEIGISASVEEPITTKMLEVRHKDLGDRFEIYKRERITEQEKWYAKKASFNKKRSTHWFIVTVVLHAIAIIALLYNIKEPRLNIPIEVIAVAASSVLTWMQAKKHNELSSSYSLTLHEIVLIKSEVTSINSEDEFSEYVLNCENAFSREHTQWFARKNE